LCEKSWFAKEKIISHQDNAPAHKSVLAMGKLRDLNCWNISLFPRFGSLWLLSLPKTQTLPRWSVFFFESRGDCSCSGYFADLTTGTG